LEHNIDTGTANNVFNMISETGNNPARTILSAMRHIPPMVIYEDSPISYMAEGQAQKFYQGEGDATNGEVEDVSVINYMIVRSLQYDNPQGIV
jgi:hypothetical protein